MRFKCTTVNYGHCSSLSETQTPQCLDFVFHVLNKAHEPFRIRPALPEQHSFCGEAKTMKTSNLNDGTTRNNNIPNFNRIL